jgi:hypothetical protein
VLDEEVENYCNSENSTWDEQDYSERYHVDEMKNSVTINDKVKDSQRQKEAISSQKVIFTTSSANFLHLV